MNKLLFLIIFLFIITLNAFAYNIDNKNILIEKSYRATLNITNIANNNLRKQEFFNYLLPVIKHQNYLILKLRNKIKNKLLPNYLLKIIAIKYNTTITNLLHNINIIPPSLALAQAAIESGWGRSRFAVYNNYYGIWCFKVNCGIVPLNRNIAATHEVATFRSIDGATRYYMWMLNSHNAYKKLRNIRATLRMQNKKITGYSLVNGLIKYSGIGNNYIKKLQKIIIDNKLSKYD